MKSSSRNVTGYILPPPAITPLGDENPAELGFEKQSKPSYIWANYEIADITNTHDTGRKNQINDDPENAPILDGSKVAGDMDNMNNWISDAANSGDAEPDKPKDDIVSDLTKLS